jgi:hypothetical protein
MPIPVTNTFDLFDWDPSTTLINDGADGLLLSAQSTSRPVGVAPFVYEDGDGNVLLMSNDGKVSDVYLDLSIQESYTLEFTLRFPNMPADLSDPSSSRVFVAAADSQGNAGGILISQAGIAVVAQPGNTVIPFSQSIGLIPADTITYLTVRLVVRGDTDVLDIYVTNTASVATTGHVLRYTIQAPASVTGLDRALVEVLGTATTTTSVVLQSFRLSNNIVEPSQRPIADAGEDQNRPLNNIVSLDGTDSSDPDGDIITYRWTVVSRPTGSAATLSGGVASSMTQDNLAGPPPNDGITISARTTGEAGNLITVTIVDPAAPSQPLTAATVGTAVTITLATDAASALTTRYDDLRQALTTATADGFDPTTATLLTAAIANSGSGFDLVRAQVLTTLVGGRDSTTASPNFHPDLPGSYQFQLIVNDGTMDSLPATTIVVVHNTLQPLGHIPNAEYIWGSLPDFWTLVPDRGVITTMWSSAIQAVAGEVLKSWQTDYSKSLADIQEVYTRKWLEYPPFLRDTGTVSYPTAEIFGTQGRPLEDGDGDLFTTTLNPSIILGGVITDVTVGDFLVNDTGTSYEVAGVENGNIVLTEDTLPVYAVIDSGIDNGYAAPISPTNTYQTNLWRAGNLFDTATIVNGDILRITSESTTRASLILFSANKEIILQAVTPGLGGHTITFELVASAALAVTLESNVIRATYIAGVTTALALVTAINAVPRMPDLVVAGTGGGTGATVIAAGDAFAVIALAGVSQITADTNLQLTLDMGGSGAPPAGPQLNIVRPVELADWQVIRPIGPSGWSVRPYVTSAIDVEALGSAVVGDLVRFQVETLSTFAVQTIHCPIVGIMDDKVAFDSANLLAVITSFATTTFSYTYQGLVRILGIPVDTTVDSIPRLQFPIETPTTLLTENLSYTIVSDRVVFTTPYTATTPPPDSLWAEMTYFDHEEVIEDNFGRSADLLREELTDESSGVEYLHAARALWHAFFAGPTISNIRLGSQVFFGLPLAERAGTILSINTLYTLTTGQIIVADEDNSAVLRSYTYPLAVGLDTNPATGVLYVEGDTVVQFAPLSAGVTVDDYVKTPRWFAHHVEGGLIEEVEKFFLFRVQLDTAAAADTSNFEFVARFVNRIKPVYTSPIFSALLEIGDDQVDVVDTLNFEGVLQLFDNPRGAPNQPIVGSELDEIGHPTAVMVDAYDGNGSWTGTAVDLEGSFDRTSPRYPAITAAGGTLTVAAGLIDPLYVSVTAPGVNYFFLVIEGSLADDGVYNLGDASTVTTPVAQVLDAGGAVAFNNVGDTCTIFTLQGTHAVPENGVARSFQYLDGGVNQPKFEVDGNLVPYYRTVNRRNRIDLGLSIPFAVPVAQLGPRVDQGLIVDDYLTMEPDLPNVNLAATGIRRPNMRSSTPAGNGLHWWFDGCPKPADPPLVAVSGFCRDYTIDAQDNIRPNGLVITSGTISRVTGHKGLSLPPDNPFMVVSPE